VSFDLVLVIVGGVVTLVMLVAIKNQRSVKALKAAGRAERGADELDKAAARFEEPIPADDDRGLAEAQVAASEAITPVDVDAEVLGGQRARSKFADDLGVGGHE